jgi:hypothetical protein
MEWTGGCLCGAVRWRARAEPVRVVNCHCGICRRSSGAAFMTFVHFPASAFAWIGAEPSRYRSSAEAERGFCAVCGSTLSMHEAVLADRVQVSLGSLDRPDLVRPDDHVWARSQLPLVEGARRPAPLCDDQRCCLLARPWRRSLMTANRIRSAERFPLRRSGAACGGAPSGAASNRPFPHASCGARRSGQLCNHAPPPEVPDD